MQRIAFGMVLFLLVAIAPAHADVLCARHSGAVVKRDVCRPRETQLDPAALGLKGDKGDPGEQGVPGNDGAPGAPGFDAEVLHVYDGNGQDLGILTSVGSDNAVWTTFLPDISATIGLDHATMHLKETIYYPGTNCAGEPHTNRLHLPFQIMSDNRALLFFLIPNEALVSFQPLSTFENGACANSIPGAGPLRRLVPVTLPFSFPLAAPLTIGFAP